LALSQGHRTRVHIFLGSSATHLEKLSLTQRAMLEKTDAMIRFAARHFGEIEFSPEDAGRTEAGFLAEVARTAIEAGATVINIPDTVGHCMPREYGERMRALIQTVHGPRVVWSVHCHDDFGCGTANALEGVLAGARQVECTLYNLGERAGNTALEEVVMAVRKRTDLFSCDTRISTPLLWKAARLVERTTGVAIPRNKAIVGRNAFSHESGIHQAGVLKNRASYEVMNPDEVGWQGQHLPLGPQSGRHAFKARLIELSIELNHNQFEEAFRQFKVYADANGSVSDDALRDMVEPIRIVSVA
jgi:2-isopropylmalate synthase